MTDVINYIEFEEFKSNIPLDVHNPLECSICMNHNINTNIKCNTCKNSICTKCCIKMKEVDLNDDDGVFL